MTKVQTSNSNILAPEELVKQMLQCIGEDPTRQGLVETPARVVKAWGEWFEGYGQDAKKILKVFKDGSEQYDEMVVVHNIPVYSHCEHHMAPIIGIAHVGYIPNGAIVGLSKLPRLVNMYARRLQVQERLTTQITQALMDNLQPLGAGVIIRARHMCIESRGIRSHDKGTTTTSCMRGALFNRRETRSEFLKLCAEAERHG